MRAMYCVFLLLPACASHTVRCDGRLQPINPPAARASAASPITAAPAPARSLP